jgi:hypothetical protein
MQKIHFDYSHSDGILFSFEPEYPLTAGTIQWIGEALGEFELSEMIYVGIILSSPHAIRASWLPFLQGVSFENPFDLNATTYGAPPGLLESIRELSERCRQATHHDVVKLRTGRDIRWLNLARGDLGDESLPSLDDLPYLQSLDLSGTNVTDGGLPALQPHIGLMELQLNGTAITDAAIPIIAEYFPNLRTAGLRDTNVSADALNSLAERLPHCKIT